MTMDKNIKKRIFIAIDLPKEIKESIYKRYFNITDNNLKLVAQDNIHVTLKFIGYADKDKTMTIQKSLKRIAEKIDPFYFKVAKNISCFPKFKTAKVLFAGIREGSDNFLRLSKLLEDGLQDVSIRKENREYIPHITLARAKNACDASYLEEVIRFDLDDEVFCGKLSLFESVLKKSGPEYNIIDEYDFKNCK